MAYLALPACNQPSPSAASSCGEYYNLLCGKAEPDSAECRTLQVATQLLPAAACAAGSQDLEPTRRKLASAQKCRKDLVREVCAAIGPDSEACTSVTRNYRVLDAQQCDAMTQDLAQVVAKVQKHFQESGERKLSVADPAAQILSQ
jgi:hypothetical protein